MATVRTLVQLLEEAAELMGLDEGRHRLEVVYDDGRVAQWWAHTEKRSRGELAVYDVPAGGDVTRTD